MCSFPVREVQMRGALQLPAVLTNLENKIYFPTLFPHPVQGTAPHLSGLGGPRLPRMPRCSARRTHQAHPGEVQRLGAHCTVQKLIALAGLKALSISANHSKAQTLVATLCKPLQLVRRCKLRWKFQMLACKPSLETELISEARLCKCRCTAEALVTC